jgi:hypothetical protein
MKYSQNKKYRDKKIVIEETKTTKLKKKIKNDASGLIKNLMNVFKRNK